MKHERKWANFKLSGPEEPLDDYPSFYIYNEHIAKHEPEASLAIVHEILSSSTEFDSSKQEREMVFDAAHLLLRVTEYHPFLALPVITQALFYSNLGTDSADTAIRYCVSNFPDETAKVLKKAIEESEDSSIQSHLYYFLLRTGHDVDEATKQKMGENERRSEMIQQLINDAISSQPPDDISP